MEIKIPYLPREPFKAFHARTARWAVLVVHRRAGKTVAGINDLIRGCFRCKKVSPRFAYLAPYRQQAKIVAWDYLKQYTATIPGRQVSESELHVKLPGDGRVTLYGADNYDALRGIYLDGAIVDEPADMEEAVWKEFLRPALSDRQGWCVWIGTPKGRNAFFRLYDTAFSDPEYFTMMLPASASGLLPEAELLSARKSMGKESFEREYECSFAAPVPGSIYGGVIAKLRGERRVQDFPVDGEVPMYSFWDVGRSDYTCIWLVQLVGLEIRLLDYYSGTGHGPGHYADRMDEWEKKHGRPIAGHYLPHDADHEDRMGGTWRGDLAGAGLANIRVVICTPDKWRGIARLREKLLPRCYIHKTNCERTWGGVFDATPSGMDCLEYYAKREISENGIISEEPLHNEYSHGCDALRTFSEAYALGAIAGTSETARESQRGGGRPRVLRGAGAESYPSLRRGPRIIR